MQMLYQSVVSKRGLSVKAKLLSYWSIYVLTLTFDHDQKNEITDTAGMSFF